MSLIMTDPAPIITFFPIFTPSFIVELAPIKDPLPTVTFPRRIAPGPI